MPGASSPPPPVETPESPPRLWQRFDRGTLWSYLWPVLLAIVTVPLGEGRRLLVSLIVQVWVRYPLVRRLVSLALVVPALLLAGLFGSSSLTYRDFAPGDLQPVEGRLTGTGYDDMGRFVMRLDNIDNPFIPPAWAATLFDARLFSREVAPGDRLTFAIDRQQADRLNTGALLVAHMIRTEKTTYLSAEDAGSARHRQFTEEAPVAALALLGLGLFCLLTLARMRVQPALPRMHRR